MPHHRVPLGALNFGGHEVLETVIEPGDLLLAYSDGVVDAQSPDGEFFGEDRLRQVLAECPDDPKGTINWVLDSIEDFSTGHTPYDDVTLMAARWTG